MSLLTIGAYLRLSHKKMKETQLGLKGRLKIKKKIICATLNKNITLCYTRIIYCDQSIFMYQGQQNTLYPKSGRFYENNFLELLTPWFTVYDKGKVFICGYRC